MSRLEAAAGSPHRRLVRSQEVAASGRFRMRRDTVELGSGDEALYIVLEAPDSAFVVPVFEDGSTILVRQWRYPWAASSWEVPAGTLEAGEDPLLGARRELEEEAGLRAAEWVSLGVTRSSAVLTTRQNHFLARGLEEVQRLPEIYEQDMIVRRLPVGAAVEEALRGGIQHSASVAALCRAAAHLGLLMEKGA